MVNFKKRLAGRKAEKPTDPVKLYETLDRAHDKGPLRPAQLAVLGDWFGNRQIAYADFTDYERVICRSDNWREIFTTFFDRPESVRESFQRLYPIRLDTMHARPITQDDELLLYVETQRLVKVIVRRVK